MKICTGSLKSMKIVSPPGGTSTTRPTGAKTREALVNILAPWLRGSNIIDFFAGTGAVGIELLSSGASHCTFVEEHQKVYLSLKKNIEEAKSLFKASKLEVSTKIIRKDVKTSLKVLPYQDSWDIFWADPPYIESLKWMVYLQENLKILAHPGSILVIEIPKKNAKICLAKSQKDWILYRQKNYGDTTLLIFSYQKELG
jgi:16S rRNA (guanine966-N2)-methyltransferase